MQTHRTTADHDADLSELAAQLHAPIPGSTLPALPDDEIAAWLAYADESFPYPAPEETVRWPRGAGEWVSFWLAVDANLRSWPGAIPPYRRTLATIPHAPAFVEAQRRFVEAQQHI